MSMSCQNQPVIKPRNSKVSNGGFQDDRCSAGFFARFLAAAFDAVTPWLSKL